MDCKNRCNKEECKCELWEKIHKKCGNKVPEGICGHPENHMEECESHNCPILKD